MFWSQLDLVKVRKPCVTMSNLRNSNYHYVLYSKAQTHYNILKTQIKINKGKGYLSILRQVYGNQTIK